ncbi:MAG: hypothetical protein G3M70_12755 [Candidatus Nitronauta litoralis]|uniref:Lipoprotein n=1 Tax=Candidatus Nitronauta litoralis TaxID=2705533 RepID=A0A7T0BXF4_9BACT|nr:MAG: hypothetical protein G3M70_12755 [Candidatus Nitronauta litoralis]
MKTITSKISRIILISFLVLGVSACALMEPVQPPPGEEGVQSPAELTTRFGNVPIPPGFDLDRSKSFIYESGSGAVKVGKLHLTGWNGEDEVIEYYRNEMVAKGWSSVSIMEQKITVMVYEQEGQMCTIIVEPSFSKTHVEINVGPK